MIPAPSTRRRFKRVLHFWFKEIASGKLHIPSGDGSVMSLIDSLIDKMFYSNSTAPDELDEYKELADRAKRIFSAGPLGGEVDRENARLLADDIKRMEHIWEFYLADDEKDHLVEYGYWAAGNIEHEIKMRDEVHQFAQLMEVKMRKHDPATRWKKSKQEDLLFALKKELGKLEALVKHEPGDTDAVASQSADVANFAMMIADVCGGLRWITEKGSTKRALRKKLNDSLPASDSKTTPLEPQS
jgi:hypothetical protein